MTGVTHDGHALADLRVNDIDFQAGTVRLDESADLPTYKVGPCKNAVTYGTDLLADSEGMEPSSQS